MLAGGGVRPRGGGSMGGAILSGCLALALALEPPPAFPFTDRHRMGEESETGGQSDNEVALPE